MIWQDTQGCEWFTYYQKTRICTSLSVCIRLNETQCTDNCVSGESECPENMCGVKGKCFGEIILLLRQVESPNLYLNRRPGGSQAGQWQR